MVYDDIAESTAWLHGLLNETPSDRPGLHIGPPVDRQEITFRRPRTIVRIRIEGDLSGFSIIGKYESGGRVILSTAVDASPSFEVRNTDSGGPHVSGPFIGIALCSEGQSLVKKIELFTIHRLLETDATPNVQAMSDRLDRRIDTLREALEIPATTPALGCQYRGAECPTTHCTDNPTQCPIHQYLVEGHLSPRQIQDLFRAVGDSLRSSAMTVRDALEHIIPNIRAPTAVNAAIQSVALTPEQVRAQARAQRIPRSRRRAIPDEDGEIPVLVNPPAPVYRGHRLPRRMRREQLAAVRENLARATSMREGLVVDPVSQEVFRAEPHIIEVPITNPNPERGTLTNCGEYSVPNGINFSFEPQLKPLFRIKPLSPPEGNWKRRFRIRLDIWDGIGVNLLARIYDATLEDYENPQVPEDDHYRILGRARAGDRIHIMILNETVGMVGWDIRVRLQASRLIRQSKRGRKWQG